MEQVQKTRICSSCGDEKSVNDFYWNKKRGVVNSSSCKVCSRQSSLEDVRNRSELEKEAYSARQASYRASRRATAPEQVSYYNKVYREQNRETLLAYDRERYATQPGRKEVAGRWKILNPEGVRQSNRNRKARLRGSDGYFSAEEWVALKVKYGNRCLCCNRVEPEIILTADHVVPVVKGGSNEIGNIQPLCQSCNSTKHTKTIDYRPEESVAA